MTEMRASSPAVRAALKAAVRRACRMAGGAASVAMATRVGETALSKYAAAGDDDHHCPLDVALDLDCEAGGPVILSALAAAQGFALTAAAPATRPGAPRIADIAAISAPTAAAIAHLAHALDDGAVTPAEARALVGAVDIALRALFDLRGRAERAAE